ncbi:MAG: non-canonical purine NTP pyrophosphatase [Candidatus Gracilibacteria bacterium]|nr:non-canonical purine NTP pyrophosphatase [Candidatus Gracilibacteria bacterium]
MKKLLIAIGNKAKIDMYKDLLSSLVDVKLYFLSDFKKVEEPVEDGKTVEKNALIKARYYSAEFGIPALGDDAGFEIEELGGEPGVMARRWGGELPEGVDDLQWLNYYFKEVKNIEGDIVHGSFPFVRCLYVNENNIFYQESRARIILGKQILREMKPGWPSTAVEIKEEFNQMEDIKKTKKGLLKLISNL